MKPPIDFKNSPDQLAMENERDKMKKTILTIALAAIVTNSIFAMDISTDTGQDHTIKKDRSMSVKSSSENRNSRRSFNNASDAKSYSSEVSFDPIPVYMLRAQTCAKTISVARDFGLHALMDGNDEFVDLNKKNSIDLASASSISISKIPGVREDDIKSHILCIVMESAKMAQANLNLERKFGGQPFSGKQIASAAVHEFDNLKSLNDPSIRLQFSSAMNSLKQPCRFLANMGRDSIQCGSLTFSFVDNSVKQSGTLISAGQNFFGISSSLRISMSDTRTDGREVARENSTGSSSDVSLSQTVGDSKSQSQKQTINAAPFLPK